MPLKKLSFNNKMYIDLYIRLDTDKGKQDDNVKEWYRGILKAEIPALISKWEEKQEMDIEDWRVRRIKIWGSCNIQDQRIWLNLELAKKPVYRLVYVVLYKIVHLKNVTIMIFFKGS